MANLQCGADVRPRLQALFCQVPPNHVLNMFDVSNIWHVPLVLEAQGAHVSVCNILKLGGYSNMNLTGALLGPTLCGRLYWTQAA